MDTKVFLCHGSEIIYCAQFAASVEGDECLVQWCDDDLKGLGQLAIDDGVSKISGITS